MQVVLTVSDGPMAGRKCWVASGQAIRVGRTASADFIFDRDVEMSSLHFEVTWQDGVVMLRDLGSTNGTFVDGQPVGEKQLYDGSSIRAGRTVFGVSIVEEPANFGDSELAATSTIAPTATSVPTDDETPPISANAHPTSHQIRVQLTTPSGEIHRASLAVGQSLTFGRTQRADIVVPEDAMMSSLHLRLELDSRGLHFTDMQSTNGVFCNGVQMASGAFGEGDEIKIGQSILTVSSVPPTDRPELPTALIDDRDQDRSALREDALREDVLRDDDIQPTGPAELPDFDTELTSPTSEASNGEAADNVGEDDDDSYLADRPELPADAFGKRAMELSESVPTEPYMPPTAPVDNLATQETSEQDSARRSSIDADKMPQTAPPTFAPPDDLEVSEPPADELEIVIVDIELAGESLRKFWLTPGQSILVGSAAGCDEVIADETLSANQWLLQADSRSCTLTQLSETPPTLINGQRHAHAKAPIYDQDRIQAGQTRLVVTVVRKATE